MTETNQRGDLHNMDGAEFVRRLHEKVSVGDCPITFFLGPGCSASSGIPASRELVRGRGLPKLRDLSGGAREISLDEWAIEQVAGYDPQNPAASQGEVMGLLFHGDEERQREIEGLCQGKFPAFGYGVLAQLMKSDDAAFGAVLTTNFDDLVEDAMYLFTGTKPLVIPHESLAGFIRAQRMRPMVVKLHGDHQLSPKNMPEELEQVQDQVETKIIDLLRGRGLVFIGYGGSDKGIVEMLQKLPRGALPHGLYWVSDEWPDAAIAQWLDTWPDVTWVTMGNFDELMLLMRDQFDLPHPKTDPIQKVFDGYSSTFADLSQKVYGLPADEPGSGALREAAERAVEELGGQWAVEIRAAEFKEAEPDRADQIYREGLQRLPKSTELLAAYALFLWRVRGDHDRAEEHYSRAVEVDPNHANILGNYAVFLRNVRGDDVGAEEHYRRALEADPNHANNLGNYAGLMLGLGRMEKGMDLRTRAMSAADFTKVTGLQAECWFYLYADGTADRRGEALVELKRVLADGDRSPGWKLSANIARALEADHPAGDWLVKLAAVITDGADIRSLEDWNDWEAA